MRAHDVTRVRHAALARIAALAGDVDAIVQLVADHGTRRQTGREVAPPASASEHELARICRIIVKVDPIGLEDNLFALGVDSLALMRIATALRATTGVLLSLDTMFERPTIRGLAAYVEAHRAAHLSDARAAAPIADDGEAVRVPAANETLTVADGYAAAIVVGPPAENGRLIFARQSGMARDCAPAIVAVLDRCRTFKTLAAHADACRDLWIGRTDPMAATLHDLAAAGFLVRWQDVVDDDADVQAPAPRIDTLAVPTRDRPDALRRCLVSYLDNAGRHSRTLRVVVGDDGADETRARVRTVMREIGAAHHAAMEYLGPGERRTFARDLARRAGADEALVAKSLAVDVDTHLSTSGGIRNALLLAASGSAALMVDDDTIGRPARPRSASDTPVIRGRAPLRVACALRTVRDSHRAGDALEAIDVDICAQHERFLGRSLVDCAREAWGVSPRALDETSAADWQQARDQRRRVRVTLSGLIGDCGWGSPAEYLLSGADWIAGADAPYRELVQRRTVVRCAGQPILASDVSDFMTTFFGVDLTDVCPPFVPVARGADHVWATLLGMAGRAAFAHLPFTLAHEPSGSRRFWPGEITRSAAGTDLSGLIAALARHGEPPASCASDAAPAALVTWGSALRRIAEGPHARFVRHAQAAVFRATSETIAACERLHDTSPDAAPEWREDLAHYTRMRREGLGRADYWLPLDVRFGVDASDAAAATQQLILDYARLLEVWPALLAAARELGTSGARDPLAVAAG